MHARYATAVSGCLLALAVSFAVAAEDRAAAQQPGEPDGTLVIVKSGGIESDLYRFVVRNQEGIGTPISLRGNTATSPRAFRPGDYLVTEDVRPGDPVELAGWALAAADGACPAAPTSFDASFPVTISAGQAVTVCAYNQAALPDGTLRLRKVGVPAGTAVTFTIAGSIETVSAAFTQPGFADVELGPGAYTVTETPITGFVLRGWALVAAGDCPAQPASTGPAFSLVFTAGQSGVLCAYNAVANHAYTLRYRWTLLTWLGADGIDVADAVRGLGENEGGNDMSAVIATVWSWDEVRQDWNGYFTSDTVGASDLEELVLLEPYWVAIREAETATWEITPALP
jgi:hypothetical protein